MAQPTTNQVAKRIETDDMWISELKENDRGVIRIAHDKTEDTFIYFEIQNKSGIEFYESKRDFSYLTAYKYVARGLYFKGMSKGIRKTDRRF
jgi:hypothetical protein